jgi:hypothetical protein
MVRSPAGRWPLVALVVLVALVAACARTPQRSWWCGSWGDCVADEARCRELAALAGPTQTCEAQPVAWCQVTCDADGGAGACREACAPDEEACDSLESSTFTACLPLRPPASPAAVGVPAGRLVARAPAGQTVLVYRVAPSEPYPVRALRIVRQRLAAFAFDGVVELAEADRTLTIRGDDVDERARERLAALLSRGLRWFAHRVVSRPLVLDGLQAWIATAPAAAKAGVGARREADGGLVLTTEEPGIATVEALTDLYLREGMSAELKGRWAHLFAFERAAGGFRVHVIERAASVTSDDVEWAWPASSADEPLVAVRWIAARAAHVREALADGSLELAVVPGNESRVLARLRHHPGANGERFVAPGADERDRERAVVDAVNVFRGGIPLALERVSPRP